MTVLTVFRTDEPGAPLREEHRTDDVAAIRRALDAIGVGFERWTASVPLPTGAGPDAVLAAYAPEIDRLRARGGYQSADVIRMHAEHPERVALRAKFLDEHVHTDDEVRFFVEGAGAFYLRDGDRALRLVATAGDLIVVPANTRHWFDMGERPHFAAIRLFTSPDGWVAQYTGDDMARRTPGYAP